MGLRLCSGWRAGRPGDEVRSEEAQGLSKRLEGLGTPNDKRATDMTDMFIYIYI